MQWEYLESKDLKSRVVNMGLCEKRPKDDEDAANLLGLVGWEMVGVTSGNSAWWYFFKRPLIERSQE